MRNPRSFLCTLTAVAVFGAVLVGSAEGRAELTPEQLTELRTKLEPNLSSEQKEVRRLAVLALGAMVDKKELKTFSKYATDVDPVVKHGALVALALRGEKAGTSGIEKELAAAEADTLDLTIAELLQPLPLETQTQLLKNVLKKPANEPLRLAVFTWIARDGDDALYALTSSVTAIKAAEVRDPLLKVLLKYPREQALEVVRTQLKSKEAAGRLVGLELAKAINSHDSLQAVAAALEDKDEAVKKAAEAILFSVKHPAIVPLLEARVKENPKDIASIVLLKEFGSANLLEVLYPLVEGDNPPLEQEQYNEMLSVIATAKNDRSKQILQAKLASSFEADRVAAAAAIGYSGDSSFLANLVPMATDGSQAIRLNAAISFGLLKDPAAISTITDALQKEADKDVKLALIRSMGEIGDSSVVSNLQFMMTERDNDLRLAAMDALVALKAIDATSAIEYVAQDPDPLVRWKAIVALFQIDPVVYGERLKKEVANAPDDAFFETLATLPEATKTKLEEEVLRSTRSELALGLVKSAIAKGRPGIEMLRKAVDLSSDKDVTNLALQSLATYAEADDFDRIKGALENTDRKLRLMGLRTLLSYEKSKTEAIFLAQVNSDDPLFQVMGIYGLVK